MTAATTFEILPAIDLRGGRVVRLRQGDFARETVYSDDPVAVARGVRRTPGRGWLHVVDLDGARAGEPVNGAAVERDRRGGGETDASRGRRRPSHGEPSAWPLAGGALRGPSSAPRRSRIPGSSRGLIASHGADRIAVAIDVRDGQAVGHGWVPGRCGRRRRRRDRDAG